MENMRDGKELFKMAMKVDRKAALELARNAESEEEREFFSYIVEMHRRLEVQAVLDHRPAELTPGLGGKECLGNGHWPGYECQCPDCDWYQTICFPT